MIQNTNNNSSVVNKSLNIDENNHNCNNRLVSKSTKSCSNLNSDHVLNNINLNSNISNNSSNLPSQLKLINSNTIQICSKFYDKSKFNVIGEQETLV